MNRLKRERHAAALRPPIAPPHLCTGRQGRRQHHKHNKHTQLKTQTGCENHPQTQVGSRKGGTKPQLTDRAEDNTTNTTKQTHTAQNTNRQRKSSSRGGAKTTPRTQQTHKQGRRQHHKHNKHTQLKTQTGCESHPQNRNGSRKGGAKPQLTHRQG